MDSQSRRRFLKTIASVGGALAIPPLDLLAAGDPSPTGEEDPAGKPAEMSIVRLENVPTSDAEMSTSATTLAKQAIDALGGMGRFVSKGDIVWIKPNIGWNRAPELAACSNPDVVATLVRLCLEAGAKKVKVGDNTCHEARLSYRTSGIEAAAKEAGAEVIYLDPNRFKRVALKGQELDSWELYPEIIDSDLVINVAVAKHHGLSRATLCMKNYMGVVGGQRNTWHQKLPACLVDVTAFMKPRLSVLDAVRVLTANGPQGGNPGDVRPTGTVAAGTDIVALDAFGAELLGHGPGGIETVSAAHAAGLGEMDYRKLNPRELVVS